MITEKQVDKERRKGRGATRNSEGRFDLINRFGFDDGWGMEDPLPPVRTEVTVERPRSIISRNTSPDLSFDRSINTYRGCEHGCIYCFARPSHGYLGLSAGLDFETKLIARPDAPEILARELSAKRYVPQVMAIGTNTDPYQPIERTHQIMRRCLEVLSDFNHPVAIVTKGTLIERDIDILGDMAARGLMRVGITITTLDDDLSRHLEPRVPRPKRRLQTIEKLKAAGTPVRLMLSPIIPGLTDHEIERIVSAAKGAGADAATWSVLRLPFEVSELFQDWLAEHMPERAAKVMARVRETHGGKTYDAEWGKRMRGEGEYARVIAQRFKLAARRAGLFKPLPDLRTDLFAVPPRVGDQLSLL